MNFGLPNVVLGSWWWWCVTSVIRPAASRQGSKRTSGGGVWLVGMLLLLLLLLLLLSISRCRAGWLGVLCSPLFSFLGASVFFFFFRVAILSLRRDGGG